MIATQMKRETTSAERLWNALPDGCECHVTPLPPGIGKCPVCGCLNPEYESEDSPE